ncbi:MAG: hypothetical protein OEU54_02885, partial [Gemmatimonadota bacterium]|nr:hypothetical protein [Gemmatimonadota bacterium]
MRACRELESLPRIFMTSDNPPTPTDGDDFSTGEVRVALERVLASERFVASARISTFLRFIVDETLEGRGSGIKAYRIATRAFGFSDTFDPQSDPYIRILARRLRRALTYYYQKEGRGDPLRIDVPKGGYVPRFQERSGDEAHAGGSPPASVEDPHQPARPAVAIVMFLDLTETEAWAHLATGLTEEVLVNLTRFSEFRVIGPLWSDRLEEGNAALGGIRARFHTDFAVYGSVHALGEGVEISVRLQDTRDATSLWAETYELDPGGAHLVELEHEITGQIATTIADSTGVIARTLISESRGQAVEALTGYEAVLRGYHWATVLTDDAYREARRALEHAVEESPSYAPAKAILSDLYFSDYLSAIDPAPGSLDRAERLAEEAVRLDPVCHDARWTLGQVHFARRRPERFVQEFEAAIALNPWKASTLAS